MPLFFIPILGVLGIGIALIRRYAKVSQAATPEDTATRLLRWAVGLLSAQRAEWGQAMLGELDHLDGRLRRLRFALGCAGAALVLPPWGRAAAGVWAMIALALGSIGLYAAVALRYGLGGGDWIAVGVLAVVVVGFLLGASALVRRPGVAVPGLLGSLLVALTSLALSGFSFLDQILPDVVHWHQWVSTVILPLAVGAAGTLWSRDPVTGKRIARLAAISAGLGLYVYGTIAVAVIGGGGPFDEEGGGTLRGTISDRLGNNLVFLLVTVAVTATVGWAGAAATGAVFRTPMRPATAALPAPVATGHDGRRTPVAEEAGQPTRVRRRRRTVLLVLLCAAVLAAVLLAATTGLRG